MHRAEHSTGVAVSVAIVLIGLALAMGWLALGGGVLGAAAGPALDGSLPPVEIATARSSPLLEGMRIESVVQFSQARDPFRPLIAGDAIAGSSAIGDSSGQATSGRSVTLQEINNVAGVLRATVIVDGVTYTVGVGDNFAGTFQVVSLSADSGVLLNGDNAFELNLGQQILK